jgi:hypothetical protein
MKCRESIAPCQIRFRQWKIFYHLFGFVFYVTRPCKSKQSKDKMLQTHQYSTIEERPSKFISIKLPQVEQIVTQSI